MDAVNVVPTTSNQIYALGAALPGVAPGTAWLGAEAGRPGGMMLESVVEVWSTGVIVAFALFDISQLFKALL